MRDFLFATGIENSYPTIAGGIRVDEMEKCGHYRLWQEDLALVRDMNIAHLRWGPPLYRTFLSPGRYDWEWTDDVLSAMKKLGIEPILDLCHFGVPDWLGNFQNEDFPRYFAEYAGEFARRCPHIKRWTPVNEILITAMFSARYGWWNERLSTDRAFVRAVLNCSRANVLAMSAIRSRIPDAVFVQSESFEYTHPAEPDLADEANLHNERRFLPLDLTYGHPVSRMMFRYLSAHGMRKEEYDFFMTQDWREGSLIGIDYCATNEHLLNADGGTSASGEIFGLYLVTRQYYERYGVPMMHTETNLVEGANASAWLWKQWHTVLQLRREGIPIHGFTWYSLTDQVDWDSALREDAGRLHPVGLYDLDRKIRKVGQEYRSLIQSWGQSLTSPQRRAA